MSLYLKYRPKTVEDLVGQDHIKQTLLNAIAEGSVSHAYIFSGPRGTGKTSSARLVAKAVVCGNNQELIQSADEGRLVDIIEIDAASNRGIEEIRDLREKIQFSPVMGYAKVYIIDEVHMLTKEAFNALLKTLEEPPAHAFFILATTEIHKVPETILSRCQHFSFKRISVEDIVGRLEFICQNEGLTCEREALEVIADNANGGMRDAISSLEQMIYGKSVTMKHVSENLGMVNSKIVEAFGEELVAGNTDAALEALQRIVYEGYDLTQFVREIIEFLRDEMLAALKNNEETTRIIEVIEMLQDALQKIKFSAIPQLPLEIACVKLSQKNEAVKERTQKSSSGILSAFGLEKKKEEKPVQSAQKTDIKAVLEEDKKQNLPEKQVENVEEELSVESLQKNWNAIIDRVHSPLVKAALKTAKIEKVSEGVVKLTASTDFYIDNINSSKGNGEIVSAITAVFHQNVKVLAYKEESVGLHTKAQEKIAQEQEDEPKSGNILDMANEIFGS